MKYRKLDQNGDYTFGAGSYDYVSDDEAIGQAIKTKILLFYGEWWEDLGLGIPMFQSFIGQVNPETIRVSLSNVIEQRIENIQGVVSVSNVDVVINKMKRTMELIIDVVTSNKTSVTVEVSF